MSISQAGGEKWILLAGRKINWSKWTYGYNWEILQGELDKNWTILRIAYEIKKRL